MSREIKFRIWDTKHKRFVKNGSSLHCQSNWSIDAFSGEAKDYTRVFSAPPNEHVLSEEAKDRYIVQQFTGLRDKNGKEIYEGDIVKTKIFDEIIPTNNDRETIGFIFWDNFYGAWSFEEKKHKNYQNCLHGEQYPFGPNDNCWVEADEMKIIGNIL